MQNKNKNNSSKFEQKVFNIDLSHASLGSGLNNSSMNKRPNLFNEKSTSRERILTKKTRLPTNGEEQITMKNYNTPSFNLDSLNNESQHENQEQMLKDFPFL